MKVALLLSGMIPKEFFRYYASIKKTLIEPYNADVFISTWISPYSEDMFTCYNPKLMRIENYDDISVKLRDNMFLDYLNSIGHIGNRDFYIASTVPMFYKIYDANQLRIEYESLKDFKYDIIIRSRMDLSFDHVHPLFIEPKVYGSIPDDEITDCMNDNNIIYAKNDSSDDNLIWDQFAFGSNKAMNVYSDTYLNLQNLTEKDYLSNEYILNKNLKLNDLILKRTKIVYGIKNF